MLRRRAMRLNTLVRVRERQQELKAQALATTRRELLFEEKQRDAIMEEQRRMLEKAAAAAREVFDPRDISRYYDYERYLSRLADEKDATIRALAQVEQQRREELVEAARSKRVVEKLEERRLAAWRADVQKREQVTSDELSSSRAAARQAAYGV